MRLEFSFSFNLSLFSAKGSSVYHQMGGGTMPRKEFLTRVSDTIKHQQEIKQLNQKEKLHNAEIIKREGPKKWAELKQELEAIVLAVSGSHGHGLRQTAQGHDGNEIRIHNTITSVTVDILFDPDKGNISYSGSGGAGIYPALVRGNDLIFHEAVKKLADFEISVSHIGSNYSIERIAEEIISSALQPTE
jgi:hypothetical protein